MIRDSQTVFRDWDGNARAVRVSRGVAAVAIIVAALASPSNAQLNMDLLYSSFIGGQAFDRAQGMTTDADGNIYIHVNTTSKDLPTTPGAVGPRLTGNQDAYLAKYSPDGKQLIWATYMGGPAEDRGYGVQVGPDGSVYAVGITKSKLFPTTPGAAQQQHGGDADFFVARFTSDGERIFSTLVGGSGRDWSRGNFYVDEQGDVYIGGETDSPNFPVTSNAIQKNLGGGIDGFMVKLSADGSHLDYATYFGGNGRDATYSGVYVSPTDHSIYFSGMSNSDNMPTTPNAYQSTYAGGVFNDELGDAFVARLSPEGDRLIFSTYLGGPGNDAVAKNDGMIVDKQGRVIVTGQASEGFPITEGASQSTFGGRYDGFISILSEDGSTLISSTLIGGNAIEETSGIDIDSHGNIFISGNTASTDFPTTPDAFQSEYAGGDADFMLSVLSPDLTTMLYSTYIGGGGPTVAGFGDRGRSLEIVDDHLIVVSGDTNSAEFPLVDATQTQFGGEVDAVLLRWSFLRAGDANGDAVFDSSDLIQVFSTGQYEDEIPGNSDWSTGDWNNDGDFTTTDLIWALQLNDFESEIVTPASIVPEPAGLILLLGAVGSVGLHRRARYRRGG